MGKDRWFRDNRGGGRRGGFGRGGFAGYGRGGPRNSQSGGNFGSFHNGNNFNYPNNTWQNRPRRESPGIRLTESQIGVTQYMSDHESIDGIIKSRYSDFQVSEINRNGEIAKLTSLAPPQLLTEEPVKEDEELLLTKYNVEILPMETWDQINKVATGVTSEPVEIDVSTSTKEDRTKIHEAVKKAFANNIVGSTINTDDKKFMRFTKYKKGVRIDNRVKWMWPGEYVYFIVHKENCDTMEAAMRIAEQLRINVKPAVLGYAGTKDRRAKTSQWFSLRKVDPRRVASATSHLRDIHIGNFSFDKENLKLGMLNGNKFRIALRNVTTPDEVVNLACESLRDRGFINYYGLQRFGTRLEMPTYEVGLKLLQGKFEEAVECILSQQEGAAGGALAAYRAAGPRAALPLVAPHCAAGRLLRALAAAPAAAALQHLPRNNRLLYLHAYQSLVWNRAASERVARAGLAPAAGDLVPAARRALLDEIEDEESDSEENEDSTEQSTDNSAMKESTDTKLTDEKSTDNKPSDDKPTKQKQKQKDEIPKIPVKVLTQEDIDNNLYTIFDVILPVPGHSIEYPPNMKDYYETLLTNDGLSLDFKRKNKSYSLSGAYRHLAVKPTDVSWRCVRYSDPYADLILSDWDEIQGTKLTGIVEEGEYKALLLTLSLAPSCYATMALREVLRADTAPHAQAAGNLYHKRKPADQLHHADNKRPKENE